MQKDYTFLIITSIKDSPTLKIDKSTYFYKTLENRVDAEF